MMQSLNPLRRGFSTKRESTMIPKAKGIGFARTSGIPEIIEKWGRGPFLKTCIGLGVMTAGLGVGTESILFTSMLGLPSLTFTVMGIRDMTQKQHTILRNFPVLGRVRYLFEAVRPEIRQYFIESDTELAGPFSRENRSLIYQRAKGDLDTQPFGTKLDVYAPGYQWMQHSIYTKPRCEGYRVTIGNTPGITYDAALFNISALSFGAISKNAILALNKAAKRGRFYHNTGEGGVSPYHLEPGGDIVWNIGTGYFSCRDNKTGKFDPALFQTVVSSNPQIKMIEIKLSQGAKPGLGGLLPAQKITQEIADTRGIPVGEDCHSPASHTAFSNARELIRFASELRNTSRLPVGIKLCIGNPREFAEIVYAMREADTYLDFVTVDGGEGGTGAASYEHINNAGMPMYDGLYIVSSLLIGAGIKDKVKVIAAGKVFSGFTLYRTLALGADLCNSARGFMFALGCISSLKCHTNKCPTGVATQDKTLMDGLVVGDKAERVYQFQRKTMDALLDMVASAGLNSPAELDSSFVMVRTSTGGGAATYEKLKNPLMTGELLSPPAPGREDHYIRQVWRSAEKSMQGLR